jgi:hypothetical protein
VTVKKTGHEMADRLFDGLECEDEGGMQVSSKAWITLGSFRSGGADLGLVEQTS